MSSFARQPRSQLVSDSRDDLNGRVSGVDSRLRRSLVNGIATMHGGGLDGCYGALEYVADQVIPDSADDDHLERWANFWGVFKKPATAAQGSATGTGGGADGTPVPAGTQLQRGDLFTYTTDADATLLGGAITVSITATAPGLVGGAAAGIVLSLVSPIAGINADFTVVADFSGSDAESGPELLGRLEARIRNAPKGGGPGDHVAWAKELPGVTRAWEFPLFMGLGTVGVTFVYDDRVNIIPLVGDVAAMQAWLDSKSPATVFVFAPIPDATDFTIDLEPNTAAVKTAVTAELADLFSREGEPGSPILKSHYDQAISDADGHTDHTVTVPAGNINPATGHLPVLGIITWI